MSKVVAVMGSPKSSGNTASAVGSILDGTMGLSTNIVKYHDLGKLNFVHGCNNCLKCIDSHKCVQSDDLTDVLGDIHDADTVIFATPVFFNMPTAQIKMVLDRMYAELTLDRKTSDFVGKSAVILITCSQINEDTAGLMNLLSRSIEKFGFVVTDKLIFSDKNGTLKFNDCPVAKKRAFLVGDSFRRPHETHINPDIVILNDDSKLRIVASN